MIQKAEVLFLNYQQAARATNVSPSLLKKLVRLGKLPVVKFGKSARIKVSDLLNFGEEVVQDSSTQEPEYK